MTNICDAGFEPTAALVLEDGTAFYGYGLGVPGIVPAELCFNTAITGYQEILTDPSYAGQIIVFTFPHIGNVGTNDEDVESSKPAAKGLVLRNRPTKPSNWRNQDPLESWLVRHNLSGIYGIDTRALTQKIRDFGKAPAATLSVNATGDFDIQQMTMMAAQGNLTGQELSKTVTSQAQQQWQQQRWQRREGYLNQDKADLPHVIAVDYGVKFNILRNLASSGCRITTVPATTTADEILAMQPDGIFLSNGPGDPAATGVFAQAEIQKLVDSGKPIFGICLGFQLLGLTLGAKTGKMPLGHRGANHPVKNLETGKVEITSQNHGFCVLEESLPSNLKATHKSLFDDTLQGLRCVDKPVFGVQYHPEASPGPQDSHYLFEKFVATMRKAV